MGKKLTPVVDQVYGRYLVIRPLWECRCIYCRKLVSLDAFEVVNAGMGCSHHKRPARWKYGKPRRQIPEYSTWVGMRSRCRNPKAAGYPGYGGSGITVCDRWQGPDGFRNFMTDMGPRPEGTTLDRLDNALGYSPDNCAWRTASEQQRNRSITKRLTYRGETKTIYEWSQELGMPYHTLMARTKRMGWSDEKSLSTPVNEKGLTARWKGKDRLLTEWSAITGIKYLTLLGRFHKGKRGKQLFAPVL